MPCYPFLTVTQVIIRLHYKKKIKARPLSSRHFDAYCYKTMSFGIKNVGATYQRAIQTCLGEQISKNVKAYVDDVVVKTKDMAMLIEDLKQTFENLKK
jgi:hypothetical protein